MSRFPRTEPDIATLAGRVIDGLTNAAEDDALEELVDALKADLRCAEIAVRDAPPKLDALSVAAGRLAIQKQQRASRPALGGRADSAVLRKGRQEPRYFTITHRDRMPATVESHEPPYRPHVRIFRTRTVVTHPDSVAQIGE